MNYNEYVIRKTDNTYSSGWEIEINEVPSGMGGSWVYIPDEDSQDFSCFKDAAQFIADFLI